MERQGEMRAADADRKATAEQLRVALEEGRLDIHEYDDRLLRAYQAKTYDELDAVVVDLPGPAPAQRAAVTPATPPSSPAAPAGRGQVVGAGRGSGWLLGIWSPWLRVAGILTVVWLLGTLGSRHLIYYWPAWALGPWGAVLLMRTVGVIGGDGGYSAERRRDRRDRRRRR